MIPPWWLPALGGAISASILALMLHSIDVSDLEKKWKAEKDSQMQFDTKLCQDSKQPTKEGNEHYENIIAARDARIVELSKRPARCLYVSRPADNTKGTAGEHGNGNGLPDSILHKYSGFCEAYRGGQETLQQFNDKVRCKLK